MRIALDTGVIIAAIGQGGTYGAEGKLLQLVHQGDIKASVCSLAIAEMLSNRHLSDQQADDFYQTLSQFNLKFIDPSSGIMEQAAGLSRRYNLTVPDSIHLACAMHSAECFITNDTRLTKLELKKFKILSADSFLADQK